METVSFCRVFAIGLLLTVLVAKTQGFVTGPGFKCRGKPADIVFVLDSSSSIWGPDFTKQLNFAKYMVDHLDIGLGPNQVRVGVEIFSNYTRVEIDLAESTDKTSLERRIGNITRMIGSTNIGDALNKLRSSMFTSYFGSRPNVRHVAIILTDGTSQDQRATQRAAKACREANIELFAIGIGEKITESELWGIVSEPKSNFFFKTPSYDALDKIRDVVIQRTCEAVTTLKPVQTTPTTPAKIPSPTVPSDMTACKNKRADVFFLLDSSASIEIEQFKKQLNVVENIVARFDISPTKTRVGVSVFGHEYYLMLSFDSGSNKAGALKEIRNIKYVGGGTETGKALSHVRSHVFNQGSIRSGAERILIVFTDGQSRDYQQTSVEAKLLRESGVKIFVVGIGPDVDQLELKNIASKPSSEFMYTFATFDILLAKSGLLTYKACTVDNEKPPSDQDICNATKATDVVFMVSNNHFGKVKTNRILKASAEVIRKVGFGGPFRFGSVFDNCLPKQDKTVGSITEESQLVSFNYGSISSLVRKLRIESLTSDSWKVRRVGLLFLDNTIDLNDDEILKEVRRAIFKHIELYAVIIGDGVDEELVSRFIAPNERIITIYSYDHIISYLPSQFTKMICKRSDGNPTFKPVIT